MNKKRVFCLFIATIFVFGLFALGVEAGPLDSISNFFANGSYKTHAKMIDFLLFFTMFFSLAYLGFTKMWGGDKDGAKMKGPIVGLSIAFGLALAFAIVSQTKFSITTMVPLAKAFLFVIVTLLLYGLLRQNELLGGDDTWTKKIITILLAIILTYIILNIFTYIVCASENNLDDPACQGAFFTFGHGILKGVGDSLGIGSSSSTYSTGGSGSTGGGSGGGGSSRGGSSGGKYTPGTHCRLDGLFEFDKITYKTGNNLDSFVEGVNKADKKSITVYAYASTEHAVGGQKGEKYNTGLSTKRANKVKTDLQKIIKTKGYKISVSSSGKGQTTKFGSFENNRRFILSTQSLSKETPSPPIGSIQGCKPASGKKEDSSKTPPSPISKPKLTALETKISRAEKLLDEGLTNKDASKVKEAISIAEDVKDELRVRR